MIINEEFRRNPAQLSLDIQSLFLGTVVAAELREPGDAALLLPAEAAFLGRSVPKRIQEFAAGRLCARRALAEFGIENFALLVSGDRQPVWPDFLVGSITHTSGFCAAVVGERRHFMGLGLDCEVIGHVTPEIWSSIFGPAETAWLESLPAPQRAVAATVIFSAKEAFYKSQFPVAAEWLDFSDLRIEPVNWGSPRGALVVHPARSIIVSARARMPMLGQYRIAEKFVSVGVALTRVEP